jgi:hypothetical protein
MVNPPIFDDPYRAAFGFNYTAKRSSVRGGKVPEQRSILTNHGIQVKKTRRANSKCMSLSMQSRAKDFRICNGPTQIDL